MPRSVSYHLGLLLMLLTVTPYSLSRVTPESHEHDNSHEHHLDHVHSVEPNPEDHHQTEDDAASKRAQNLGQQINHLRLGKRYGSPGGIGHLRLGRRKKNQGTEETGAIRKRLMFNLVKKPKNTFRKKRLLFNLVKRSGRPNFQNQGMVGHLRLGKRGFYMALPGHKKAMWLEVDTGNIKQKSRDKRGLYFPTHYFRSGKRQSEGFYDQDDDGDNDDFWADFEDAHYNPEKRQAWIDYEDENYMFNDFLEEKKRHVQRADWSMDHPDKRARKGSQANRQDSMKLMRMGRSLSNRLRMIGRKDNWGNRPLKQHALYKRSPLSPQPASTGPDDTEQSSRGTLHRQPAPKPKLSRRHLMRILRLYRRNPWNHKIGRYLVRIMRRMLRNAPMSETNKREKRWISDQPSSFPLTSEDQYPFAEDDDDQDGEDNYISSGQTLSVLDKRRPNRHSEIIKCMHLMETLNLYHPWYGGRIGLCGDLW